MSETRRIPRIRVADDQSVVVNLGGPSLETRYFRAVRQFHFNGRVVEVDVVRLKERDSKAI